MNKIYWPPEGINWYYSDEWVAIAHADCRDILPKLPKVDLVLTDPPYGIDIAKTGKVGRGNLASVKQYIASDWDKSRPNVEILDLIRSKSVNQIIFGGNYMADLLPPSSCWLVWDKENSANFADCELMWTSFNKAVKKYTWRWNGMLQEPQNKEYRYHPTQKPTGLLKAILVDHPADLTLDTYMGSGSTLIACKSLNRKCIGIEISEKYCEIAAKRCSQQVLDFRNSNE